MHIICALFNRMCLVHVLVLIIIERLLVLAVNDYRVPVTIAAGLGPDLRLVLHVGLMPG